MLPPLRHLQSMQAQVGTCIACDIDDTLINKAMSVSNDYHSKKWPCGEHGEMPFPSKPCNVMDVAAVRRYSEELDAWLRYHTNGPGWSVSWVKPEDLALRKESQKPNKLDVVRVVLEHVKDKKAILVATEVRYVVLRCAVLRACAVLHACTSCVRAGATSLRASRGAGPKTVNQEGSMHAVLSFLAALQGALHWV